MSITLSVVCPIYNEEKYIAKCIDSILEQDFPHDEWELFFVDGMSTDRTREIIRGYSIKYPFIKVLDNPMKIVPYAMNKGIKESTGSIIIRLDAHVIYPTNYFSTLVTKLKEYDADNVGCVCNTLPTNDTSQAIAIAETLSSPFGVGNSMFRIGVDKDMEADTVPFGCFKREVFDKVGLYDLDLVRNQDDELNARIINNGGKIILLAGLSCDYYARDKFSKLYKMYFQYGLYKPLVNKKLGKPATLRQLVPPLFLFGLIFGLVLSGIFPVLLYPYLAIIILYLVIGMSFGYKIARKHHKQKLMFLMPISFFIVHIGYGWGYIRGICKVLFNKPFNVLINR